MGTVNVNRGLSDQFYRYKMPKIIAKVEGKGNGIKTVIVNMVDVAKALNRPPTYTTKFFGCELGAQTQFDLKNERFIVNGSHEAPKLQDLLDFFIRRFVLCPSCDNPETILGVLQKKGVITTKCKACGYSGTLDSTHKLTTFILKNPPNQNPAAQGASVQSGKKTKRKTKEEKQKNGEDGSQHGSDNEHFGDKDDYDEDDDWCEDTGEDAVAKRMEALTTGAKGLMLNEDLEKTQQERMDLFYAYVKKRKEDGNLEVGYKDVAAEAERLDIREKAPLVLCELLLDDNAVQQITMHRLLFLRFTHGNPKAQKYLLGGVEQVVKMHRDALMVRVPHLLKALYDADILEEELLIDWSKKVSKKYVSKEIAQEIHEKAQPFIKWLQEAEEEESSGSEEETVEVVYSDRVMGESIKEVKETSPKAPPVKKITHDEDDLDIDAI